MDNLSKIHHVATQISLKQTETGTKKKMTECCAEIAALLHPVPKYRHSLGSGIASKKKR